MNKVSAALGVLVLAAVLGGCADSSVCRSGSTVAGVSPSVPPAAVAADRGAGSRESVSLGAGAAVPAPDNF
jgi:hypothetical protein